VKKKKNRSYLFTKDTYMKILKSIVELETENTELKQVLKECLGVISDQIKLVDKKIGKEKFADEYHDQLCHLHNDIRGMLNEQQKP